MANFSCPQCGAQCSERDAFCGVCGAPLSSLRRCGECGAVTDTQDAFCPRCGAPLALPELCEECGAELDADAVFCPKCGCPVSPAEEPQPAQQSVQQYAQPVQQYVQPAQQYVQPAQQYVQPAQQYPQHPAPQYPQHPVQQIPQHLAPQYPQQLPPQPSALRPSAGGIASKAGTLLIALLFLATPFLKLYTAVIDTWLVSEKWSFNVFDFFDKAKWASDIYEPISGVVSGISDYLPGAVTDKFAQLDTVEGIVMLVAWSSVALLAMCALLLISSLFDIASADPFRVKRFWSRATAAMGCFLVYTVLMLGFLTLANHYIGNMVDSGRVSQGVAAVLDFDPEVFRISPIHYIIQAAGLVFFGVVRVKKKTA